MRIIHRLFWSEKVDSKSLREFFSYVVKMENKKIIFKQGLG